MKEKIIKDIQELLISCDIFTLKAVRTALMDMLVRR